MNKARMCHQCRQDPIACTWCRSPTPNAVWGAITRDEFEQLPYLEQAVPVLSSWFYPEQRWAGRMPIVHYTDEEVITPPMYPHHCYQTPCTSYKPCIEEHSPTYDETKNRWEHYYQECGIRFQ